MTSDPEPDEPEPDGDEEAKPHEPLASGPRRVLPGLVGRGLRRLEHGLLDHALKVEHVLDGDFDDLMTLSLHTHPQGHTLFGEQAVRRIEVRLHQKQKRRLPGEHPCQALRCREPQTAACCSASTSCDGS